MKKLLPFISLIIWAKCAYSSIGRSGGYSYSGGYARSSSSSASSSRSMGFSSSSSSSSKSADFSPAARSEGRRLLGEAVSTTPVKATVIPSTRCVIGTIDGGILIKDEGARKECLKKMMMATATMEDECVPSVSKASMLCQARKQVKDLVESSHYKITASGNKVELEKDGDLLKSVIIDTIHYDVAEKPQEEEDFVEEPTLVMEFNKLGNLTFKKGKMPKAEIPDPCKACLDSVERTGFVEGQKNCGGCELDGMTSTKGGQIFRKAPSVEATGE